MKILFFILIVSINFLSSCSKSNNQKSIEAIDEYLSIKLKNPESYESIKFIESREKNSSNKKIKFIINHLYNITNSKNEKVKMSIIFYLDKNFKILKTNTKSINGEYGSLTGNVYWKYNDYIGDKADSGAEITLYSLDSIRGLNKYETTADFEGNYKFDEVLTGSYFLIVRSNNTTDCPDAHIFNLNLYSEDLSRLFNIDFKKYQKQFDEIDYLDSLSMDLFSDFNSSNSNARLNNYDKMKNEKLKKSEKLIKQLPESFKSKIKLYTPYSNSLDFNFIRIEENKNENENTDFGITCI